MTLEFSQQIFERSLNIKFYQNPSSGSRVVPCGQTDIKLIVAFRNFANAPKKGEEGKHPPQSNDKAENWRNTPCPVYAFQSWCHGILTFSTSKQTKSHLGVRFAWNLFPVFMLKPKAIRMQRMRNLSFRSHYTKISIRYFTDQQTQMVIIPTRIREVRGSKFYSDILL